ncbi:polyprenol monophosphomannose synthase [Pseudoclavibacter chungangensis]|uniref:Polyprenol monophosphomannose synthase n=1 Tax=Pseudoclavibacter chungangensis TaxID=587635 RepID=A0A7J5C0S3_9MICO|nr:polyprenol monophosphomannose synthase [Pseudoclavibacter chungangensis]KAB1659410.1 polyprenol monophosphomannose synthase [Pseudoclavibacter chungangensis]NYJ67748.1 glycosyltransferase involved in cell wall biosynthesis [Pseudoclavibacter chungangensis]
MSRALVIVPTYNERENVESIVHRVLDADRRVDVLVVDDGSPDGTGAIADRIASSDPRVRVLHREGKLGLGSAYVAGFRDAITGGYDWAFEFDADGSHPPERLPEMLDALEGGAALVIGTRWMPGGRTENWPLRRRILSRGASIYARTLLRSRLRDITAGYRGYRVALLESVDLDAIRSNGYCFQIETAWLVERLGHRIVEVPITFVERAEGASKMSIGIVVEAIWRVLAWGIGSRLRDLHRPPAATH